MEQERETAGQVPRSPEKGPPLQRTFITALTAALAMSVAVPAPAQTSGSSVQFPSGWAPGQAPCVRQGDGTCVPVSAAAPLPTAATAIDASLGTVPAASGNGTPLPARPAGARQVAIYLAAADAVTFTIATAQPSAAPAATITVVGSAYAVWLETLGPGTNLYVTAVTGAPRFRWL